MLYFLQNDFFLFLQYHGRDQSIFDDYVKFPSRSKAIIFVVCFEKLRYPIYQHSENWIVEWIGNAETNSGFWKFNDEKNILGTMYELALTGSIYPLTKQNWRYFDRNFNVENINELPIFCIKSATPTRLPSFCNIYIFHNFL